MNRTWLVVVAFVAACAARPLEPARVDTRHDTCAHCRMIVSDVRLAAQIVAPGDEPLIFDDLGCLRDYLAAATAPPDAIVFVADHRTGAWVDAAHATFTKRTAVATPMGSGIVAHADRASRDADPSVRNGSAIEPAFIRGGRR